RLVADDVYRIRAVVSNWIADPAVDVVVSTGGTGPTGRDNTVVAVRRLLDRELPGFGELFRRLSYEEIGSAAMLSDALGGTANGTLLFCLPGSTGACHTAWNGILREQLGRQGSRCRMAVLKPRLLEGAPPGAD
ncbi:MAG: molybdopterin-binding protein, partial [Gammaproteobacteria bacterium]